MSRRLVHTLLIGLVGAAIVHIAVLLTVPFYSDRDAWTRIAMAGEPFALVPVSKAEGEFSFLHDNPFMRTLACRIEIDPGMARIRAEGEVALWTAAIFDRSGRNLFSLNDRTTIGDRIDLVIATPLQMIELRKDLPEGFEDAVFVELDANEGLAVIRIIEPDRSWRTLTDNFIEGASCLRL